ncbi:ATP-binding protein [Paeniroseomonas aquatica]|uniref:ATP-binding protein n=1 Tax=Paeniroseomonas aquatica TaxID=373043 RepID=UPI003621EFFA
MPMIISNPRLPDNPTVFANDAFVRLTGYPREEILGRNCRFLQGPATDRDSIRRISEAVRSQQSIEIDIRNHRKDGSTFWNRLLLAPVHDAAGELTYFFASQMDVTIERERLAGLESRNAALVAQLSDRLQSLSESEARLRFATEAGKLGIWELDLRRGELTASAICRLNYGRPADPSTSPRCARWCTPRTCRGCRPGWPRASPAGPISAPNPGAPAGRHPGWIEARAQVVTGLDGAPLRLAGTSRDITNRKNNEAQNRALLELDDCFRALDRPADLAAAAAEILGRTLEASRAGYGTIDLEAETVTIERDWNAPGVASLAGVLRFRDYGSYIEDLKRGETVVFGNAEVDPRTAGNAAALRAISAVSVINMPVTERNGLVALLYINHATAREWQPHELAFVREVAQRTRMAVERRRAEDDLRALAESLESQVVSRTEALMEAEAALRQSQKMEAVGQLTGGLAHDFNNLLAGITGSLELMRTRIAQGRLPEVQRYLTAARGAADRAAALTHRLLAFSRRQTLAPRPTDMNKLVAGMEELIRRTIGPAITLEVVGAGGLWATLTDQSQLENALLNLCINSRDAMPNGGRLTIETSNRWLDDRMAAAQDLPAGQYVALSVSDTGTGMTPDIISKAFDPFFTTKPIGQGTGLGLSMIYGFARQSGGQVRIYSEIGQGSVVSVYLPRHVGATESAESPGADPELPRAEVGESVLVVDDEPTIRMLVTDVLQELGYAAIEAEDGAGGLKLLRSPARVDLLVTDVGLPGGMNGRQLADAGRALRPGLKVLFITGYAENAAIGHGHLEPGMHVLTKPFAMETLANRIRALIEGG